jgi:Fe-S-cluster containining protein
MDEILDRYGNLLQEVDQWFNRCSAQHPEAIACHHGCSKCCRGLFDITLLDALYLRRGFELLPDTVQLSVQAAAAGRLDGLTTLRPDFIRPWILNNIPEEQWDEMMPEDDEAPCVLLSQQGSCLVYAYRPMTCRLNGIPMIDSSGERLFDEWCSKNFIEIDPMHEADIRHPFNELFTQELLLFRELMRRMFGRAVSELDTIIPAAVFLDQETARLIRLPGDNR